MNIAYILPQVVSGSANGVKSQAETWAQGLSKNGHEINFISPWGHYDWKLFDLIHVFGYGVWLDIVPAISTRTDTKIVISPIIDSNRPYIIQKLASYCGLDVLHLVSPLYCLRKISRHISAYYARSQYEANYLINSFDVNPNQIKKIPLSCRFANASLVDFNRKEKFCLHVSILSSKNKNVKKLIDAAIKYKFRLILAGSYGTNEFKTYIDSITLAHPNIECHGFLSEQKLIDLYLRARVFALPSLFEGVGLVALEAAALGADIVLTNRGGPKEYYGDMAFLVSPDSIDSIGKTISRVLSGETMQPSLSQFIKKHYSIDNQAKDLEFSYMEIISRKKS